VSAAHLQAEIRLRRVNRIPRPPTRSFKSRVITESLAGLQDDELQHLDAITSDLPGNDWAFTTDTVSDLDPVRFFNKTRVFILQQYIRLLSARHAFSELLGQLSNGGERAGQDASIQQVTQSKLCAAHLLHH
jgi:hypothetical protein